MSVAPILGSFVDAEKAVVEVLESLAIGNIDTETPANLKDFLPFVRVSRIGGQSTQWQDMPRIDVDVFGSRGSRGTASDLALACQAVLLSFPHLTDAGVIDRVDVDVSPNETPWANTEIVHFTSSYKVTVRR